MTYQPSSKIVKLVRPLQPCVRSIKISIGGAGVVDGEGGNSEECLKWDGGGAGVIKDLS